MLLIGVVQPDMSGAQHLVISAALAFASVGATAGSIILDRAATVHGSSRGQRLRDNGWSIVLMVDGILLLLTAVALACI